MKNIKFSEDWDKKDWLLFTTIRKHAYWCPKEIVNAVFPSKTVECYIQSADIMRLGDISQDLLQIDTMINHKILSNEEILNLFKKLMGSASPNQTVILYWLVFMRDNDK